jgi:hypothetical protein
MSFVGLARAAGAHMGDVGGELGQHRPRALDRRGRATQHEGELTLERSRGAARQWRIDPRHAGLLLQPGGHSGGRPGIDARHVDQQGVRSCGANDPVGAEDDALDDLGNVQAGDHVVDLAGERRGRGCGNSSSGYQRRDLVGMGIAQPKPVAAFQEPRRDGRTHDADPDNADT